ncbi:hypothetical protein, partial [Proteus mirabilis]|uniref:hypothetical protein n=1 Tax=Proteus mirabilis TaxID=584 RepID=UPI0013CF409C
ASESAAPETGCGPGPPTGTAAAVGLSRREGVRGSRASVSVGRRAARCSFPPTHRRDPVVDPGSRTAPAGLAPCG